MPRAKSSAGESGKLRIGDHWNAITIIALSQSNPLKAIAEFVENSIDAHAMNIAIVRGKAHGAQYLKVSDDGDGIADFHYVATHIGDSIKRKLKARGEAGLQGEFGIGLLSFWTVGEELSLTSTSSDGAARRMKLVRNNPGYAIREIPGLFEQQRGTELQIQPLLSGVRSLSGEKIQAYLASELRDRIARSGVRIRVIDRTARKELIVEPRKFRGRLLHNLPEVRSPLGDLYAELYLTEPQIGERVGLYKSGTRIISDVCEIDLLNHAPWNSGFIEGIVDAAFLQLTPGTRGGVIYDDALASFAESIAVLEEPLAAIIDAQRRAEEEEASRSILRKVTRALKEAFLMLPREEYGWLAARAHNESRRSGAGGADGGTDGSQTEGADGAAGEQNALLDQQDAAEGTVAPGEPAIGEAGGQSRSFFEFPGPLYRLTINPSSSTIGVGERRKLHAIARDKSARTIDSGVAIEWRVEQGAGSVEPSTGEFAEYVAPQEPELAIVAAVARSEEIECRATSAITVTAELLPHRQGEASGLKGGLPGYTFRSAPGELWRSRYEEERALIVINNAHADFVFAARTASTKLRYVARLFAKEIVLANFPGAPPSELLERVLQLVLYMEEYLK